LDDSEYDTAEPKYSISEIEEFVSKKKLKKS
jgi:hypothetical protein